MNKAYYYRARYQCETCGYTGYRSTISERVREDDCNTLRKRFYCAGTCDGPNRPHRLLAIQWSAPVPLPEKENPCLIDGHKYHAKADDE